MILRKIIFPAVIVVIIFGLSLALGAVTGLIKDRHPRKSFNESMVLYGKLASANPDARKEPLREFDEQSLKVAAQTQNKEGQAIGLYNAGTARLEEFIHSGEMSDLEKAVGLLQQSAVLAPRDAEVGKKAEINLSIARSMMPKIAPLDDKSQLGTPDKNKEEQ